MTTKLRDLIDVVKTGSRDEAKLTQKEIEKYLHNFDFEDRESRNDEMMIFLTELKRFDEIIDVDHKCYFINVLKWPFFFTGEKNFEVYSGFILKINESPCGIDHRE